MPSGKKIVGIKGAKNSITNSSYSNVSEAELKNSQPIPKFRV